MNGHRPARSGGGSPLDVVGWFHDWLGRRRDSLRRGDFSAASGARRAGAAGHPHPVLRGGIDPLTGESFDRAFRAAVDSADTSPADTASGHGSGSFGSEPPSEPVDLPLDADVDSITGPADLVELPAPAEQSAWLTPPEHVLRRRLLHHWLERWYGETDMPTIGGVGEYVRRPWVRVSVGSIRCHLNANTTRQGVAAYLALVREEGPKLPWHVVAGRNGVINEVAVGRDLVRIGGFHLFTDSVFKGSGRLGGARPEERRRSDPRPWRVS